MLKHYYYYFKDVFTAKECADIIEKGKKSLKQATVLGKEYNHFRDSNVSFLNDKWIYDRLWPLVFEANKNALWNYEVDYAESIQFTEYKINNHYNWHSDGFIDHCDTYICPDNIGIHNKIRKISVSVSLSDSNDYEGGDFIFQVPNYNKDEILTVNELKSQGTMIVFPSYLTHKIVPVTKGVRYSLVMWCVGYPFK